MGGLGVVELVIILVVVLIIVGVVAWLLVARSGRG